MIPEKMPECQEFESLIEEEKSFLETKANKKYKKLFYQLLIAPILSLKYGKYSLL